MSTNVLYIAGWGRSGSTILSNSINEIPGYLNIGELNYAWEKLFLSGHTCGCGAPIDECELWGPVFTRLYGGLDAVPVRELIELRRSVPANLDLLLNRPARDHASFLQYAEAVGRIYQTAAEVAGASVIVETSKTPTHLNLLMHAPNVQLHVLHLVRDPRATAHSWMRKKKRVDVTSGQETHMDRLHPVTNCRRYVACNLTLEAVLRRSTVPHRRLRYENFCAAPASTIETHLTALGLPFPEQPFRKGNQIELGVNHTIWGNPGRARTGITTIRADDTWTRALAPRHRALVSLLTAPFLWAYDYPVIPPLSSETDPTRVPA